MRTSEYFTLDINGWEVEITLPIEFFPNPGYPQTRHEPGEPAHIEDVIFDESEAIETITKSVAELVSLEREGIAFTMVDAIEQIEIEIDDENSYLNERLLQKASDAILEREYDYYEYKRDERMGI